MAKKLTKEETEQLVNDIFSDNYYQIRITLWEDIDTPVRSVLKMLIRDAIHRTQKETIGEQYVLMELSTGKLVLSTKTHRLQVDQFIRDNYGSTFEILSPL